MSYDFLFSSVSGLVILGIIVLIVLLILKKISSLVGKIIVISFAVLLAVGFWLFFSNKLREPIANFASKFMTVPCEYLSKTNCSTRSDCKWSVDEPVTWVPGSYAHCNDN